MRRPLGRLQQRQSTQDGPKLLHATAQQFGEFLLVLRRDIEAQE